MKTNFICLMTVLISINLTLSTQASAIGYNHGIDCGGVFDGFDIELDSNNLAVKAIVVNGYSTYELTDCSSSANQGYVCQSVIASGQPGVTETKKVEVSFTNSVFNGEFSITYNPDVANISSSVQYGNCNSY